MIETVRPMEGTTATWKDGSEIDPSGSEMSLRHLSIFGPMGGTYWTHS